MSRQWTFAAVAAAMLAAAPACAGTWTNYGGYRPIPPIVYALPYGLPAVAYTEVVVGVPVVTYAPVATYSPVLTYAPVATYAPLRVRVYDMTRQPPYYNVPPYAVAAPY